MIVVELSVVIEHECAPTATVAPRRKFDPVIVIDIEPVVNPRIGVMLEIVGVGQGMI